MTIGELFDRAISWETEARALYAALARAFPAHPALSEVWWKMAIDESEHAALLHRTKGSLPAERLSEPLGESLLQAVDAIERELTYARAAKLRTLHDAYELAHRLESSEINGIFQLLVLDELEGTTKHELLRAQFDGHIERLDLIAREFDKPARMGIELQV